LVGTPFHSQRGCVEDKARAIPDLILPGGHALPYGQYHPRNIGLSRFDPFAVLYFI
jgi:hypothetical protein